MELNLQRARKGLNSQFRVVSFVVLITVTPHMQIKCTHTLVVTFVMNAAHIAVFARKIKKQLAHNSPLVVVVVVFVCFVFLI